MSIGLLIILILYDQTRYDHFHDSKDQIYRIVTANRYGYDHATVPVPLRNELSSYTGVKSLTQMVRSLGGEIKYDDMIVSMTGYFADPGFFDVFSFPLKAGNPENALKNSFSVVLTEAAAERIFGADDPIGKTINYEEWGYNAYDFNTDFVKGIPFGEFIVSGVLEEPAYKSHLKFDFLFSMNTAQSLDQQNLFRFADQDWQAYQTSYIYVMLKKGEEVAELNQLLEKVSLEKRAEDDFLKPVYYAQSLADINPGKIYNYSSSLTMPSFVYYVFAALALMVILLACFNYTNLSVARAITRAKEIGVRKVNGASRHQLIFQFLMESVLMALIALFLALLILLFLKQAFMDLWINRYLDFNLDENGTVYLGFTIFAILIGLAAGLVPGFYLSKFQPIRVLSNFLKIKPAKIPFIKKFSLYKVLIVTQFTIALFFLITTLLIARQLKHYKIMDYGFVKKGVVNIELQGNDHLQVKQVFSTIPEVEGLTAAEYVVGIGMDDVVRVSTAEQKNDDEGIIFSSISVDRNYLSLMELDLIAGDNFPELLNDQNEQFALISEKAIDRLGLNSPHEAIGSFLYLENETAVKIIGVVSDFVANFAFKDTDPLIMRYVPDKFRIVMAKVKNGTESEVLSKLQSKWSTIDPDHNFKYGFLEDQINGSVQVVGDISKVVGFIAGIAIAISLFGLLGITTFATETRIKEVGIRKTMGAKVHQLIYLLSRNFIILLLISILIASPLAYYVNNFWLSYMAHKTTFTVDIIITGISMIAILGLSTIAIQTTRISMVNPTNTLRNE